MTFTADVGDDERDHVILFSPGSAFDAERWFTFGNVGGEEEVDLGWLAAKFDHLGAFSWVTCPQGPDHDVLVDQCSPAWTFSVSFRLPTMRRGQARGDARYVMSHKFRSYWRAGYNRRVSCSPVSRTRQRCKVSVIVGDVVLWGRVSVYMKRDGKHP